MRRYQVVVRPEAESDITEAAFYYAQIDDDVAALPRRLPSVRQLS